MLAQPATNREQTAENNVERIRMLAELRLRYLTGTLDEVLFVDDSGLDRLLDDLLDADRKQCVR